MVKDKPKKARSLFFRDKTIVSQKKKLKALEKKRKTLIKDIKDVVETYHNKSLDIQRTSGWLERLPLQSLQDLYKFLAGKHDYGLTTLELRNRLRDEHNEKVTETAKVDKEIYLSQIDLLMAKIECFQSKLEDE
jgi:IS30 family transposase